MASYGHLVHASDLAALVLRNGDSIAASRMRPSRKRSARSCRRFPSRTNAPSRPSRNRSFATSILRLLSSIIFRLLVPWAHTRLRATSKVRERAEAQSQPALAQAALPQASARPRRVRSYAETLPPSAQANPMAHVRTLQVRALQRVRAPRVRWRARNGNALGEVPAVEQVDQAILGLGRGGRARFARWRSVELEQASEFANVRRAFLDGNYLNMILDLVERSGKHPAQARVNRSTLLLRRDQE